MVGRGSDPLPRGPTDICAVSVYVYFMSNRKEVRTKEETMSRILTDGPSDPGSGKGSVNWVFTPQQE